MRNQKSLNKQKRRKQLGGSGVNIQIQRPKTALKLYKIGKKNICNLLILKKNFFFYKKIYLYATKLHCKYSKTVTPAMSNYLSFPTTIIMLENISLVTTWWTWQTIAISWQNIHFDTAMNDCIKNPDLKSNFSSCKFCENLKSNIWCHLWTAVNQTKVHVTSHHCCAEVIWIVSKINHFFIKGIIDEHSESIQRFCIFSVSLWKPTQCWQNYWWTFRVNSEVYIFSVSLWKPTQHWQL